MFPISLLTVIQLAEHVSEYLKPHTTTIAEMVSAGLNDPSHNVAVAALSASTILIGESMCISFM